jgi:hypothetical protein
MPTFIDRHPEHIVPRPVLLRMVAEDRVGSVDQHGVQSLAHCAGTGAVYCIVEAPSIEAVLEYHAARKLPCEQVRELHLSLVGNVDRVSVARSRMAAVRALMREH